MSTSVVHPEAVLGGVRNHPTVGPETRCFFHAQPYHDLETFGPPPLRSDTQLERDIEREFFWSPFVRRDEINVAVDDGLVTLTGTVGTYLAYEEDRDAHKSGATAVISHLKVR